MNLKQSVCTIILVFSCITLSGESIASQKASYLATTIFGEPKNIEDTAITVGLSFANFPKEQIDNPDFICPISSPIVTSSFGSRVDPITFDDDFHNGIDLATFGEQTVFSIADGVVVDYGYSNSYGNYIKIQHKDGYSSLYAHLSEIYEKTDVLQGDAIGVIGDTGFATGVHLHFELMLDDQFLDPSTLVNFYEN